METNTSARCSINYSTMSDFLSGIYYIAHIVILDVAASMQRSLPQGMRVLEGKLGLYWVCQGLNLH